MTENIQETFTKVLSDILERYSFMFAEFDAGKAWPSESCEYLHTMITFGGSANGAITLTAPAALCAEMAANVLGLDSSEVKPLDGEEALKELANIVCGELTVSLFGEKAVFDLTVPAICLIDTGKWRELSADSICARMWVDDKPLLATLMIYEK